MEIELFLKFLEERDADQIFDEILKSPFWRRLTSSETNAPDVYVDLEAFFLRAVANGLVEKPPADPVVTKNMFVRIWDGKWGPIIAEWMYEAFGEVFNLRSRGAPQEVVHALNAKKPEEAVTLVHTIGSDIGGDVEGYKKRIKETTRQLLS